MNLVVKQGYSFKAAADAVGVADRSLREWHEKLAPEPEPCGDDASVKEMQDEVKEEAATCGNGVGNTKKATAYFAKDSQ